MITKLITTSAVYLYEISQRGLAATLTTLCFIASVLSTFWTLTDLECHDYGLLIVVGVCYILDFIVECAISSVRTVYKLTSEN